MSSSKKTLFVLSTEAATLKTEKVAKFIPATAQPTVNPLKGWEEAPTTVPDTSKVVPYRNYTYPKVEYQGTVPLTETNEIANETIYPEVSVPVDAPIYHLYNKTVASESALPVVQNSAPSGSEVGVYDSSTPQDVLPAAQTGTLEPTSEPLVVMNANELQALPVQEVDVLEIKETPGWVVNIPSEVQPVENNGVEKIKISFIDKTNPVQNVNEVTLQPPPEGNSENIKISFLGNTTTPVSVEGNMIGVEPSVTQPEHQNIRISFEKEKEKVSPTGIPLVHEATSHVTLSGPSTEHVLATPAPPMPSGPGVVNPFEGGIVDRILANASAMAPPKALPMTLPTTNQNITVDFLHNAETGASVVQQPHVTMQQHRK